MLPYPPPSKSQTYLVPAGPTPTSTPRCLRGDDVEVRDCSNYCPIPPNASCYYQPSSGVYCCRPPTPTPSLSCAESDPPSCDGACPDPLNQTCVGSSLIANLCECLPNCFSVLTPPGGCDGRYCPYPYRTKCRPGITGGCACATSTATPTPTPTPTPDPCQAPSCGASNPNGCPAGQCCRRYDFGGCECKTCSANGVYCGSPDCEICYSPSTCVGCVCASPSPTPTPKCFPGEVECPEEYKGCCQKDRVCCLHNDGSLGCCWKDYPVCCNHNDGASDCWRTTGVCCPEFPAGEGCPKDYPVCCLFNDRSKGCCQAGYVCCIVNGVNRCCKNTTTTGAALTEPVSDEVVDPIVPDTGSVPDTTTAPQIDTTLP